MSYTPEEIEEMKKRANKENFIVEIKYRENRDSHDVYYFDKETKEQVGYGYIGKRDNPEEKKSLVRCPACRRENYAMNVSSGYCTWCPFTANDEVEE